MTLEVEEYVEQAYFFRMMAERMQQGLSTQELLVAVREELLSTTKLPLAIDYMASELRLTGGFATAMAKLAHYFTPFQTFVVGAAESERGRFDFETAMLVLQHEANYRAAGAKAVGIFLYQFETLCRNRLGYDRGLEAMAGDPIFDSHWKEWILTVRRQIGIVDLADLIYVRSEHYQSQRARQQSAVGEPEKPILFGEKEGRIALANRRKDPLLLFSAFERHLGYPSVPHRKSAAQNESPLSGLAQKFERLETRLKLLEEERDKGAIDITRFYGPSSEGGPAS